MTDYKELARQARIKIISMIYKAQTSHVGSNLSCVDIATVLYANLKPEDSVVWSKGWAAATIYYFLAKKGIISREDLEKFPNEPYLGLAETSVKGVEVSGGAMGHGLPVAVGMALGKKRAKEEGIVYCVMSDGEMQEGTTWESTAISRQHRLGNLVVFIDVNQWCAMGRTKDVVDYEPLEKKWESFGWYPIRINGHIYLDIENALGNINRDFPTVIICDTIKGKGVSWMEGHLLYHYKNIDDEEYKKAMQELQENSS